MQKKSFYDMLCDMLVKNGVPEDKVDSCISSFADSHDLSALPDDFSEIDIIELSGQIADEYKKTENSSEFNQEIYFPDFENDTPSFDITDEILSEDNKAKNLKRSDIKRVDVTKSKSNSAESVKGSPLYWCLFVLLLPILIPLFLTLCVFIAVLYVLISVVIVAFVVLLVAVIASGTAFSLVGVIYGITQFTKSIPIALFELGIGVALGGLTMLLSILIYNFAIRILPKLYKSASALTKKIFHGIGVFNTACKKECKK